MDADQSLRTIVCLILAPVLAMSVAGCRSSPAVGSDADPIQQRAEQDVSGVWRLIEYHDWDPDGNEVESLGIRAPGLFVYTPQGSMSLHIMTERDRKRVDRDTTDAELGQIYRPYIGYYGTYDVDYDAMVITHNIEGAKSPNRIGRSAPRTFYFEGGDLVLDFKSDDGWRFCRRLKRLEAFR